MRRHVGLGRDRAASRRVTHAAHVPARRRPPGSPGAAHSARPELMPWRHIAKLIGRPQRTTSRAAGVAHQHLLEVVGRVFGRHAHAATRDLLGHDRVAHDQRRDQVAPRCSRRAAAASPAAAASSRTRTPPTPAARAMRRRRSPPCRPAPAMRGSMPSRGQHRRQPRSRRSAPSAPPIVNSGASVPPDVPLPSAIDHEMNFITHRNDQRARPRSGRATIAVDVVIADAQRPRREVADDADHHRRRSPATTSSGSAAARTRPRCRRRSASPPTRPGRCSAPSST